MFFLLVVMKVPVIGMIYLLWWASRDQNEADQPADEGGEEPFRRRPKPRRPIGPRRGPHGGGARPVPGPVHEGRSRQPAVVVARSRETARSAETVRK